MVWPTSRLPNWESGSLLLYPLLQLSLLFASLSSLLHLLRKTNDAAARGKNWDSMSERVFSRAKGTLTLLTD